ncbi:leucyl-tRNA synthetase [Heterostelium album PN500]|uniref:leucine--tRNA ligase n=1 Tax=Heterostelium pallidum (strain ATCC 26659 / Pp 5 / PN500) TaxID=670386 RepID=D3B015_HETP5|nr:leucyl-tRNA synthetase [Heterostelium album PN500]EFA84639.1 leucyl-tRNA synthetase [Heterostelium album PN500]|eukprot:XP_020436752.1 leucyl-tRNA synthetase [Heterostelium album PN500]
MSTAKLDFIRNYELEIQKEWEETKAFEVDAPENQSNEDAPKYMASFPYPYMNGRLHIGHVFTITKAEFMCQYQRLKGKRVLFPFGFHCTGMPIKVCADKLKNEMAQFGCPPVFPVEETNDDEEKPAAVAKKDDPLAFKSKKSKVQAKTGGAKYQWQIMQSMAIPDEEIPKFADSAYWLNYFPPHCKTDLQTIGMGIDWRRSFITTDVNQYYDSFVRWQFETLRELGKVKYGKRYSIWSTTDNQQCADHERASGEGVQPNNFTLIKLEVLEPVPECLKEVAATGKKIYLVPGTVRPETMYGQTNCWILPTGKYGAFQMKNGEVFICTERSARNMSYQELTEETGKYPCLAKFTGDQLLGAALKAPLAVNKVVYVLPMLSIDENKGTGVVTSVPSDAPDDYAALHDLKQKEPLRKKFGIKDEWVLPFEVVPIIDIPGYSNTAAVKAYQDLNIKSQNDRALLDQAKDVCYLRGFTEGIMIVGEHAGKKVQDVKKAIKDQLIESGQACNYSEPTTPVISRSGDECVVALTDQWYINYGEDDPQWRDQVNKTLESMELFSAETKKRFETAVGWLNQWACSRSFGLGTKLPWDEQFLIESLSDSTIYMAFYTIAHLLHQDFNGKVVGPAGIAATQMTRAVWDHILLDKPYPEGCEISKDTLAVLKREFNYWYPLDLRVSGIDLVQNHLTFFLYNHAAIFAEKMQPKGIRANGFVQLNGAKMSKSSGNFLTLFDAVQQFSADGTRIALADAGDGIEDANFVDKTALTSLFKVHTQVQWVQEMIDMKDKLYSGESNRLQDVIFISEMNRAINKADEAYAKSQFREALHTCFFDLLNVRDHYKLAMAKNENMSCELIFKYIETQAILLFPIIPHFSQKVFSMIGKGSILAARWPESSNIDYLALRTNDYLKSTVSEARNKVGIFLKNKNKGGKTDAKAEKATIYITKNFPKWKQTVLLYLQTIYNDANKSFTKDVSAILEDLKKMDELKPQLSNIMAFVRMIEGELKTEGKQALDTSMPFDEQEIISQNMEYICRALELTSVECQEIADTTGMKGALPAPGKPTFLIQ